MSDLQTAFIIGFIVATVTVGLLVWLLFRVKCRQCSKETQHEQRIHDNE